MLPSLRALNAEAGPSRPRPPPYVPRNVERTYTGPDPASLPPKRDRSQAEKYFARVSNENILPSKWSKVIGIGGWVVGGFAVVYMALYADFGKHEHVFSPLRRAFKSYTHDLDTLSPAERSVLGMDTPPRPAPSGLSASLREPTKKPPT
ncbi:uncharacterized protein MKK02DRAFT_37723 [Dioszegia hungarica]|uniref:Uncharacterized protein n=1 Tax=Dioszegia hungarica TaxID=4972 RepID=A0AA38H5E9_9TREE|nr:uncharacterized protein MKK02DRAFT_37723 [Dioszegia hungarica]KAI9634847.1 hypothetical protein MKK02DRAFT_37723 [Dioszegia hungarica]